MIQTTEMAGRSGLGHGRFVQGLTIRWTHRDTDIKTGYIMLLTGSLAAISNLSYSFDVFCRSLVVRNSFEMEQCIINRLLITPAFLFTIYGFF